MFQNWYWFLSDETFSFAFNLLGFHLISSAKKVNSKTAPIVCSDYLYVKSTFKFFSSAKSIVFIAYVFFVIWLMSQAKNITESQQITTTRIIYDYNPGYTEARINVVLRSRNYLFTALALYFVPYFGFGSSSS